jgi:hypothetical protein
MGFGVKVADGFTTHPDGERDIRAEIPPQLFAGNHRPLVAACRAACL